MLFGKTWIKLSCLFSTAFCSLFAEHFTWTLFARPTKLISGNEIIILIIINELMNANAKAAI